MENFGDIGLYIAYALIGLAILGIVVFAIARIIKHPEGAKSFLIGLVAMAVVFGISYALSTGMDANTTFADMEEVTEGSSHLVGAGLKGFYLLSGVAILSILYVEVVRLFK